MKFNNPSIIDEIKSTSNSDLSPDQKTNRLTEINNYKDSIRSKMKGIHINIFKFLNNKIKIF